MRKLILFIALSFLLGNQSLFSQVPSYVPTNGLVGYWPFSGNASDGSGNGNNGIVNGATLIADRNGIANSAYGFNGFSSTIDYSNQIIPSNNSFTISIWVYANNGGLQEFFHQNRWPGAFYFGINNGFLRCGDNWQNTGVPVEISNWIHFVIVRNYQNNVLIYKNGIQVALNPSDIALGGSLSDPLVLGKQYPNNLEYLNGKLDDIGIWNRALTPQEVTALYTSCTTPAPTGTLTQTFCATPAPTVASLTVTGTGIQWYAAANGGTALATTTALVNGTTYYASQTVSGCESTTRLAVTVTLNDPQITASATTICSGTPVTLSASTTATVAQNGNLPTNLQTGLVGYWPFNGNANDVSGNANNGTVNGATLTTDRFGNANSAYEFNRDALNYITFSINNLPISNSPKSISVWVKWDQVQIQNAFHVINYGAQNQELESAFGLMIYQNNKWFSYSHGLNDLNSNVVADYSWTHLVTTYENGQRKIYVNGILANTDNIILNSTLTNLLVGKAVYFTSGSTNYFNGKIDDISIYNRALSQQEITQLYNSNQVTYLWSTGDTTATINPTPTATTTYWCDVTVNGVTCRKSVTVTVNTPVAPTGALTQTFCATPAPTIASLTVTGTGIQWYAAANGGTALATTTALVNATTYYASQTVSGCESTTRLAVTVSLNDPQITASATNVCSGTPVNLTASTTATVAQNCNLPANLQTGLVGYWPFCGNANDASGNANNGTVNGATLTTDRFGNANSAYNFDGVGNNIVVNNPSNLPLGNSNRSFSCWFNYQTSIQQPTYNDWNSLICYGDFINTNCKANYLLLNNNQSVLFAAPGTCIGLNTPPLNIINNWHFATMTYENGTTSIYIDNQLISQNIMQGVLDTYISNLFFGMYNNQTRSNQKYNLRGKIDEIGIWNRALSPAEISQLYTAAPTYLWSTGDTTATINPSPTATTTYWCDVTVNGVTCRKSVTITVNTTPVPSGNATQTFCASPAPTIANLTATGTGIQWYAAANGGTALATTTALVNGTTYYASQTVSGCESTTRLAVTVSLNDPQITASATTVCSGTAVSLSASTTAAVAQNGNLPTNLQTGLIGYWPFNGNANDVSGNANNGTVNGATLTTDRFGNANSAYSFDGNDYLSGNLNIDLNLNFTISSWVNPQSLNGGHFVQLGIDDGVTGCNGVGIGKGGLTTYTNDMGNNFIELSSCVAWNPSSYQIANNIWSLLTITKNNQGILYFVNGSQVHSISSTSILPSNGNFYFGSTGPNPTGPCYYKGMLDEILVYNRALSPSEIAQLYTATPTYLWSTGETTAAINPSPTTNTTYWCDVTVNGVTCRKSITINVNPNITPTFTQVAAICYGAPAPTLPTNSIENITGTWSPAFNNTATTLYTFTPTAGLCATPSTMTVTVNPIVTPTFTQVGSICYGAPAPILPTNSIENITGTWAPAFNNTATTTYTFTPTAGLCATTATMTVTVNPLPIPSTGVSAQTFCANIYPTLQNIVVNPSNVNWYNSTTSTTPLPITSYLPVGVTTYYASQYDLSTGCESNIRLAVSVNVLYENSPSTIEDQTYCSSDEKTIGDLKTGGLNILWYTTPNGGTPVSNSIILSSSSTLYAAIFNPVTGCESPIRTKVEITIINCQLIPNNLLTLNDNDLNDNLNIQNIENFPVNQIEIYNRLGELVWKTDYYDNTNISFQGKANVSGVYQINNYLPTGTYYFILKYYDPYHLKYNEMKSFLYINNNN